MPEANRQRAFRRRLREAIARKKWAMQMVDRLLSPALRLGAPPYSVYARLGPYSLPWSTATLRRIGLFPLRDHFSQPLFNDAHLIKSLSKPRSLPGINWRYEEQVALLRDLEYADELVALRLAERPQSELDFHIENGAFESGDAEFLYALIRHIKPRLLIEIGSGNSTKMAQLAVERNGQDFGLRAEHLCIDPYGAPWLESLGVRVIRERIERVGLQPFGGLGPNDLVFVDSSHVIRPQGDVLFECLEMLPSLPSGVIVHFHDIFSPRDYPDDWIRRAIVFYNEQYLLEAMVSDSERYEVVAALNLLKHTDYDDLAAVCPYLTREREPGSFYIRIR
jgi:Methyltransferase domain